MYLQITPAAGDPSTSPGSAFYLTFTTVIVCVPDISIS